MMHLYCLVTLRFEIKLKINKNNNAILILKIILKCFSLSDYAHENGRWFRLRRGSPFSVLFRRLALVSYISVLIGFRCAPCPLMSTQLVVSLPAFHACSSEEGPHTHPHPRPGPGPHCPPDSLSLHMQKTLPKLPKTELRAIKSGRRVGGCLECCLRKRKRRASSLLGIFSPFA